jgi:trigger factor
MAIDISTKQAEGLERRLAVSVPVDDVRSAEDRAARRYATQARVPGFRPGKAPPAVVRKKFADAIRQEAIETLVQEAFKTVLERDKLDLATQPHVHDLHFHEGQPLTFELHLEVRPTIELARTTGFRVTRTEKPVTDEQVAEQVEHLRDQRATWTPVTERALAGDMATVLLATADDSGAIPEGKEYRLVMGGGQAIAPIEALIMSTDAGTTQEAPVTWPDDFPDEAQRGKTKTVRVQLTEVKRKSLPELDDAFAREVGDFDSLDALRAAVREDLGKHAVREADADVRQKLMDDLVSANPFAVPASWVNDLVRGYAEMYQIPEGEHERFTKEFRPLAERQVRRDLVIETIAAREKLAASEADVDARVSELAAKRGAEPGAVYASLQKAGRIKEIERSITEDKVFGWLLEKNEIIRNA